MEIEYELFSKQKSQKNNLLIKIDLYQYAEELYKELDSIGMIERMNEIPQLGVIKVKKCFAKTRFDYVMLQLYLHKIIKKYYKEHPQDNLRYSYNNTLSSKEFRDDYIYPNKDIKPSMGDILQMLTIVYNIGHFYNTFTASRALTILAEEDKEFRKIIINASKDKRYQHAAKTILSSKNYQRLHLLNSILILERCDTTKQAVSVALEILYAYINEQMLSEDGKLKYVFSVFKNVRTVSYVAYDLPISKTPLAIDFFDEEAMCLLMNEVLSEYNDNKPSNYLIKSIVKLLDDTVYNENADAICYYKISRKMASLLADKLNNIDYYENIFLDKKSVLNCSYSQRRDYVNLNILKLTFSLEEREISELLLADLEKTNNTRVGYYDRNSGNQTILVSIKSSCNADVKRYAAFKVLKCTIKYLRKISNIDISDKRFLLVAKFFLFYLFDENPVEIKPTISRDICVICTRGKVARINAVKSLLTESIGSEDENHEVAFLLSRLFEDSSNDTTIAIPASILVYQKDAKGRKLCEFDGLIIYPMRKSNQVLFLEAKNRNKEPSFSKKCLSEKLKKVSIDYSSEKIEIIDYNACWKYSI